MVYKKKIINIIHFYHCNTNWSNIARVESHTPKFGQVNLHLGQFGIRLGWVNSNVG